MVNFKWKDFKFEICGFQMMHVSKNNEAWQ